MTNKLKPWSGIPFELVVHGEIHHQRNTDYDRRLSLISFDNAIEYSISTYLNLKPIQRGGLQYENKKVDEWLRNFHTKIDFFLEFVSQKQLPEQVSKADFVWYHDQRNIHYHSGTASVPNSSDIDGVRVAAFWVFSVLFEIPEADLAQILSDSISEVIEPIHAIPAGYAVPDKVAADSKAIVDPNALAAASLIGKWDQNNEADIDSIRKVIDEF